MLFKLGSTAGATHPPSSAPPDRGPKGRTLLDDTKLLGRNFARALGRLRRGDRWLDFGAGTGAHFLEFVEGGAPSLRGRKNPRPEEVEIVGAAAERPADDEVIRELERRGSLRYLEGAPFERLSDARLAELGAFTVISDSDALLGSTRDISGAQRNKLKCLKVGGEAFDNLPIERWDPGLRRWVKHFWLVNEAGVELSPFQLYGRGQGYEVLDRELPEDQRTVYFHHVVDGKRALVARGVRFHIRKTRERFAVPALVNVVFQASPWPGYGAPARVFMKRLSASIEAHPGCFLTDDARDNPALRSQERCGAGPLPGRWRVDQRLTVPMVDCG